MNAPLPSSTVKFFGPLLPYEARARWDYCAIGQPNVVYARWPESTS